VLARLAAQGVHAEALIPPFPSLTFPAHYTMVTGLDPDEHGIIHNTIHDVRENRIFKLADRAEVADGRWWGGYPVWASVADAGLRSATLFWPGSEAEIAGQRPHDWLPYDERMLPGERVAHVLAWLDRPANTRPSFITLYFELVDTIGHAEGPDGPRLGPALAAIDREVGRLVDGIAARGLADRVNLVIVSDHGMAATSPRRVARLSSAVSLSKIAIRSAGQVIGVDPLPGAEPDVLEALVGDHRGYTCWPREQVPERFRYGRHPRAPRVVCLADVGWTVVPEATAASRVRAGGAHGYDPEHPSMHALFIAHGPAFRRAQRLARIEAREVYHVLTGALGIPPAVPAPDPARIEDVLAPR
jgi:predicted AlkP superfamily pyrophosphatase or phosphodiesterase